MPSITYALKQGEHRELKIIWGGASEQHNILLDGAVLATFPDRKALETPRTFTLAEGSTLRVFFKYGLTDYEFRVHHNGVHLQPTESIIGTNAAVRNSGAVLFIIAVLTFLVAFIDFSTIGFIINCLYAGVFVWFGLQTRTEAPPRWILPTAIGIYLGDAVIYWLLLRGNFIEVLPYDYINYAFMRVGFTAFLLHGMISLHGLIFRGDQNVTTYQDELRWFILGFTFILIVTTLLTDGVIWSPL